LPAPRHRLYPYCEAAPDQNRAMNYQRANLPAERDAKAGSLVPSPQAPPVARDPYASAVGAYGVETPSDTKLDLFGYVHLLVKHRWMIVSIIVAAVALGAVMTLMQTPLYTSTVRLQIDRNAAQIVKAGDITPERADDDEFMGTQFELLRGRAMAERVASALKLGDDTTFSRPREFSIVGFVEGLFRSAPAPAEQHSNRAENERAAADIVLANRFVRPVVRSRLVDISYSDPVPGRAQRIAAAYADAFIASNLDKRFEANSYAKVFLEDQLQQLKLRLEQSEKALLDFGQKEEIVETHDKASIAEMNLASANAALGTLIAERIKNEQQWKQLEPATAINLQQLLSNPVIEALRTKRSSLVTEYQQKLGTFKPNYPAMIELNNQIAEIDRQLVTEVNTLKDSYKATYQASLDQENEMKARIETLKQQVLDLQKRLIKYNILKREVDTSQSLYDGLLQRFKEVDVAAGVGANNLFIVDKASSPGAPSSPKMLRALLISFVLGLAVALGAAFLLERLDDTLRSPEDVERTLGYATLGIIPKIRSGMSLEAELADPRSQVSEAYRSLCTALQFSTDQGLPKTLLVTSAGPGEGKSTTSATLARHFANIGLKVLLVDADLRKPTLHTKLRRDNESGLTNCLTGASTPPELLQKTDVPNLAFLASGPLPPNAADLLGSSRFLSFLSVGSQVFDLIVVDSPPVMGLADAPLLSTAVTATIFVVGAGLMRTRLIRDAVKRLHLARASVIGTVITRFDTRSSYGYGYGYGGYGYGGYYGAGRGADRSITTAKVPELTGAQAEG
jgi:polysaccharide biosynthesis transport protein